MEPSWHGFGAGTGPTPARNRASYRLSFEYESKDARDLPVNLIAGCNHVFAHPISRARVGVPAVF